MQARPTIGQIIIYALGQFGWALASFCVANALIYFYAPPEDVGADFPAFIKGGSVFIGLTLIGIIGFGGRILDGFTDPMIATYSDRMQSKMGKRKKLFLDDQFHLVDICCNCLLCIFYWLFDSLYSFD